MTERRLLSAPENVDLSLIPLTEYGLRHGLLTEDDLRRLRAESLPLLRCQAERLTGGRSSSLPAETAEALLDSVFYTVSLALKRCASPEEALTLLRQQPLDTLFAAGQKRLTRKVQAARVMHDELTARRCLHRRRTSRQITRSFCRYRIKPESSSSSATCKMRCAKTAFCAASRPKPSTN